MSWSTERPSRPPPKVLDSVTASAMILNNCPAAKPSAHTPALVQVPKTAVDLETTLTPPASLVTSEVASETTATAPAEPVAAGAEAVREAEGARAAADDSATGAADDAATGTEY